ncbi:hypothetical protein A3K73_00745 [Candidatus Pacearchaeota archaeon RBG_13_36_9]|nr:MAG: hypothetical protein A3K73_00745 [Candidatus Pacearchaeota archaeon RBG_13_36_9]
MERTLFFVKPCFDEYDECIALPAKARRFTPEDREETISFLEEKLGKDTFRTLTCKRVKASKEFWEQFYIHVKTKFPKSYEAMCTDFADKEIIVYVLEGENIIERVRKIVGPTKYELNIGKGTLRERFSSSLNVYRTAAHASNIEGVKKDLELFEQYGLF